MGLYEGLQDSAKGFLDAHDAQDAKTTLERDEAVRDLALALEDLSTAHQTIKDLEVLVLELRDRIAELEAQIPAPRTRMGVYNGNPGEKPDEKSLATFGSSPEIATSYYQTNQPGLNVAYETARIKRGTSPLLTLTTKSGPVTLADIGSRSARGEAFLTTYITALRTLSEVDVNVPVYATLEHEFEVKRNEADEGVPDRGAFKNVSDAVYAAALSRFLERCHEEAPKVVTLYWFGYSAKAAIRSIQGRLTTKPKAYSLDPYRWEWTPAGTSFDTAILSRVRESREWFGADARVGVSEFGTAAGHGDASNAVWFTGIRSQLTDAGVEFACLFNRGTGGTGMNIDNQPLARTAFSRELTI